MVSSRKVRRFRKIAAVARSSFARRRVFTTARLLRRKTCCSPMRPSSRKAIQRCASIWQASKRWRQPAAEKCACASSKGADRTPSLMPWPCRSCRKAGSRIAISKPLPWSRCWAQALTRSAISPPVSSSSMSASRIIGRKICRCRRASIISTASVSSFSATASRNSKPSRKAVSTTARRPSPRTGRRPMTSRPSSRERSSSVLFRKRNAR